MRKIIPLLCMISLMATTPVIAQYTTPKNQNPAAQQKEVDTQLASKLFQSQDYQQAADAYMQLYTKYGQINFYNQYIECLLRLQKYEEAEKELKEYIRKTNDPWKAQVDLLYAYSCDNKTDKADKLFNDMLKKLPTNKSSIVIIENYFRGRNLNRYALNVLEKGAQINTEGYPFYMEFANLYYSTSNYTQAFEYYFLDLEQRPGQYDIIKSRLQSLLFYDVNKSIADEMRIALLKKTQEKPDNKEFAQLLIWFALQEEDYDIALTQCKSLDLRYDNQDGQILNIGDICLSNRQYDIAKEAYEYLYKKGKINPFYGEALIGLIQSENQQYKEQHITDPAVYQRLSKRIDEAYNDIGSNDYPGLVQIQADILCYQLNQPDQAIQILQNAIEVTNSKIDMCKLKLELGDIYLYTDEVWESTLLYSQVDKSMKEEPLGHEARYRNAQLRYFIGEFAWAETQLNVLKAATSKLIANDAMSLSLIIDDNLEEDTTGYELKRLARADYKIYQHKEPQALQLLDSIIADGNSISIPHALCRKAQLLEQRHDYSEANELYLKVFTDYPDSYSADEALMKAALLEQNQLNQKEEAKQHYEQLIDLYPTSLYTAQAKKNYRKL